MRLLLTLCSILMYLHARVFVHSTQHTVFTHRMERSVTQSNTTGTLTTSLAEDVFFVLDMQKQVLHGFLVATKLLQSETFAGNRLLVQGLTLLVCQVQSAQRRYKHEHVHRSLEDMCSAANDFFRMSLLAEDFTANLLKTFPCLDNCNDDDDEQGVMNTRIHIVQLETMLADLVVRFTQDAVYAAEQAHVFIFRNAVRAPASSMEQDLFSDAWLNDWTHNQVALSLVRACNDYLTDCQRYLGATTDSVNDNDNKDDDDCNFLYNKAVIVTVKAVVCFYVRCLIEKADSVTRRRKNKERLFTLNQAACKGERLPFQNRKKALIRMRDDITVLQDFFRDKVSSVTSASSSSTVALDRIVTAEIFVLELIHECLEQATDSASLEAFIVVIHKRTGADALVTRYLVGDLWLLAGMADDQSSRGKRQLNQTLDLLEPDLRMVSNGMKERASFTAKHSSDVSFVCLGDMLRIMYEDRIAQGVLPLCWPFLPKVVNANGNVVVAEKIRSLTRNIAELRWKKPGSI